MTVPLPPGLAPGASSAGEGGQAALLPAALLPAALTLATAILVVVVLLAVRGRARRRRALVRLWLVPARTDDAPLEDVVRLLETWHQQLLERWWRRIVRGQCGLALELAVAPAADGSRVARMAIVCPEELTGPIEGALTACYPDARLTRSGPGGLPPVATVVRLKKRRRFLYALRTPDEQPRGVVDGVLSQMAALRTPAIVQYVLTPTPQLFDRYSRARFAGLEQRSEHARALDPGKPGLRSEVLGQELHGGLGVQHRPLFFAELRVAAGDRREAEAVAALLRGETGAENRFVERLMRPWARGPLYLRRLAAGVGNPIPGWRRGVLSSMELATLWQLPSPGLRAVRIARAPIPRVPAPPEVSRAPEHVLARDEDGVVGIRPEDKSDGLGLIGGQKTGKTSLLCRTVQADARDPACALVVLMPKPGDARTALSMIPRERVVHYLDLEAPEIGFNPLATPGDPAMVADRIVDAFRDVHAEGDIRGSSDRYLRQAAQAVIGASRLGVLDGPPTLWHMHRMLLPSEVAFRERVVEALEREPRFADSATFFGRELPGDLAGSPAQTTAKLDAPRNKILRLLVEPLDRVLRHPVQVSIDELIARREVLVVDGKMGTFGSDNTRVMLQFLLTALYGALQRQQQRPEAERVRVAVKVDEAHLIINESFADAMATLRSAGLEVVAAWQYGEQIQDPKVRAGMMSLLRQRCMFSMGESQDARDMSAVAMAAYTDMIRDDAESRARLRITPDTVLNLPNHFAVCSWISRGARVPAFLAQTLPLRADDAVIEHHLVAQRARGGHVPDRLPDPLPDIAAPVPAALPSEPVREVVEAARTAFPARRPAPALAASAGGVAADAAVAEVAATDPPRAPERPARPASSADLGTGRPAPERPRPVRPAAAVPAPAVPPAPAEEVALDFDPAGGSGRRRDAPVPARPTGPVPESYLELDLDDVRGVVWDDVRVVAKDRDREPSQRELEILQALWSYRFLFVGQIHRRWWADGSLRSAQHGLTRMARAGWVRRLRFQLGERGDVQRAYCIARPGFDLARGRSGRDGPYVDPEATWRDPQAGDPRRIVRDLHVNGWALAFRQQAPRVAVGWRGPRDARLTPPRRKVRGEWLDLAPDGVTLPGNHRLRGFDPVAFKPVSPDATLELRVAVGERQVRYDLLVEVDRGRSVAANEDRLRRYDALISGWSRTLDRYVTLGTPPSVVFVCADERAATNLARIADRIVVGSITKAGADEADWPFPGRRGMFFAAERDVHQGSLEALQLPEHPPELRARLEGTRRTRFAARRVHMVDGRLLRRR